MGAFRLSAPLLERVIAVQEALAVRTANDPVARLELKGTSLGNNRTIEEIESLIDARRSLAGIIAENGLTKRDYILTTMTALELLRYVQWREQGRTATLGSPTLSNVSNAAFAVTHRPIVQRYHNSLGGGTLTAGRE